MTTTTVSPYGFTIAALEPNAMLSRSRLSEQEFDTERRKLFEMPVPGVQEWMFDPHGDNPKRKRWCN